MKKNIGKEALELHKKLKGKLNVTSKVSLKKRENWSLVYTPGVGAVAEYLAKHPEQAHSYTIKNNTVAVISDGTAVLGLGNIGPIGALPVMEGKAAIFKEMAGINAIPIVLNTQDTKEIVQTIKNISVTFGGINLEDFSAPHCFVIEDELKKSLSIPVMHDDQHGTAIVVLAGLINAAKVTKKNIFDMKVVVIGAGAAGTAIASLLVLYGIKNVIVSDSKGLLSKKRTGLSKYKKQLVQKTNPHSISGNLENAIIEADVFIGVSGPKTIHPNHIKMMAEKPIVFALANPTPEIDPELAQKSGAYIIATGRSDFPNQINNALVFPGIFRGALDHKVPAITDEMKIKAAENVAKMITRPTPSSIIPKVTAKGLVDQVAKAIK
ncbi:MAG: NADP-dependent malic enzyme [Candidatus Pacebacteria bacterium]|nr:NADP-dependent malic enzyme [Candidatus Paceibacterota bacterium]